MNSELSIDVLLENFAAFDDWEDRYQYLIELGKSLPVMLAEDKTEENKVHGCMSRVWMTTRVLSGDRFDFDADSDAMIVKGLIAVLKIIYSGRTREDISTIDIVGIFTRLGLDRHLSPNRRNGFYAMVERIKMLSGARGRA